VIDIVHQINATHRDLGDMPMSSGAGRSIFLRRTYPTGIEDVWEACTDPKRISRWLAPVSGDLRLGGSYQLEGNAGGEIVTCQRPTLLRITWSMGPGMDTELELRLASDGDDSTILELEHTSPADITDAMVREYGPGGTIGIGGGWDLALTALDLHIGGAAFDVATWEDTPEAKAFARESCGAWGAAIQQAWGISDDDIDAAVAFGISHFAPEA